MRVPDPTPFARGLAVAAACMVGIPMVCRWIENSTAQAHPYSAVGVAALVLFAVSRGAART